MNEVTSEYLLFTTLLFGMHMACVCAYYVHICTCLAWSFYSMRGVHVHVQLCSSILKGLSLKSRRLSLTLSCESVPPPGPGPAYPVHRARGPYEQI